MGIHREGYKFIIWTSIIWAIVIFLSYQYLWELDRILAIILNVIIAPLWLWIVWFFRLPKRDMVSSKKYIVAPADGKVVVIEEVDVKEYFEDRRVQISIFMSPFNVHVNRSPIAGMVKYIRYHQGKYLVAWHPKSSEKNERNTVVIENESGVEILIRQIAGKLARKIRFYVEEGDEIQQANEFGFIKFGSRVDLFLPIGTTIDVDLKQKVKGGITIIGTLPKK